MDRIELNLGQGGNARQTLLHFQTAVRKSFTSLLSIFTSEEVGFFISGGTVTVNTVGSTDTVSINAGVASLNGEIIEFDAQSIDKDTTEVAWLQVEETYVDVTPVQNNEGAGSPNQVSRKLILAKGDNTPALGQFVALNAPSQIDILQSLFSARLMRVGSIFIWNNSLDNFDGSGLGQPGTDAEGLALCNGENGTPNMCGLVPVGAINGVASGGSLPNGVESNYTLGDVFGKEKHQLTENEMPSHNHSEVSRSFAGGATSGTLVPSGSGSDLGVETNNTGDAGGNESHENRQPSRAVLFVMVVA